MPERTEAQKRAEQAYRKRNRSLLIRLTPEEWERCERRFGKKEVPAEAKRLLLAAITNRKAR